MDEAVRLVSAADIVMVVGTSLQVYPAASLLHYARADAPLYLVDPKPNITTARVEVLAKKPPKACRSSRRIWPSRHGAADCAAAQTREAV